MRAVQQSQQAPLGLLFDSSLDGIDQVLALAVLFHLQSARRIRVASLSTGLFSLEHAAFLDAVARFHSDRGDYYRPGSVMLPIGIAAAGPQIDTVPPMISAVLAKMGDEGGPAYPHTVTRVADTAEPGPLIRNALMAYHDENAAVVLAGPPANLLSLLAMPEGAALAGTKARVLSIAGGRFDGEGVDPIVAADVTGFQELLAEWPTPVVMAGMELNDPVAFPEASLGAIAEWAPEHPIVDAHAAYSSTTPASDRPTPTQALAALLYAVSPEEDYFELSEPGTIAILDDGRTRFTPSPDGRHHHLIIRPDQTERVLETYVTLVTEPPSSPR